MVVVVVVVMWWGGVVRGEVGWSVSSIKRLPV